MTSVLSSYTIKLLHKFHQLVTKLRHSRANVTVIRNAEISHTFRMRRDHDSKALPGELWLLVGGDDPLEGDGLVGKNEVLFRYLLLAHSTAERHRRALFR